MLRYLKILWLTCLVSAGYLTYLYAAADDKDVALMLKAKGKVELSRNGNSQWYKVRRGSRINSGEVIRTGDKSLAAMVFTDDKSLLKVRSNSNITIHGKRENNSIIKRLSLSFGEMWAKVTRQKTSMRVETPSGVATVKGTEFNALYVNDNFLVYCQTGLIEMFNQFGTMMLGANEMGRLIQGAPPERIQGDPNDIFNLSNDDEGANLEIEFEDSEGNKKKLVIEF
ncbi:MAG: FecR domain-containing protein [bacterium]